MNWFCAFHAALAMGGSRCREPFPQDSAWPLPARHAVMETGETKLPDASTGWATLLALQKLLRYKFSEN